ncbi:MAG: 16S rRNA (guanine(966)-N(2))-methyltransferase RsmD [Alphaproteobacteria bacterium]|nr:16S rRNA (guanine(966)-N(2))-methyltransferase RsmD [Alphaproteobacteria bacterium]
MRVTAGRFGGRALVAPGDRQVRPTSDKVRQAIFNVLSHGNFAGTHSLDGARVIDLFAGTGALGIEALSRGASFALFVDDRAESRSIIRENIESLGLTGTTKIWRRDATSLGHLVSEAPFDLALIDPPYRSGLSQRTVCSLLDGAWLTENALLMVEQDVSEPPLQHERLVLADLRSYGDTQIQFWVRK